MTSPSSGIADQVGTALPFLRRYARALTGNQTTGDRYAAAALEAVLADTGVFQQGYPPKIALFRTFHSIWISSGSIVENIETAREAIAQKHLSALTSNTREALLLHTIEGFPVADVAAIMQVSEDEAQRYVEIAREEMAKAVAGKVLVIEDEAIIAMDIESIVAEMGHRVVGVARTRDAAVRLGRADPPDLILADIQLADDSSGIDAVNDLLGEMGQIPVVFITAFPQRLLTGERPEPAFLISKPYSDDQVRSAVSQAMFFSSTEGLEV